MQFRLIKRAFVNGALREAGAMVELRKGVEPGSALVPADAEAEAYVKELAKKKAAAKPADNAKLHTKAGEVAAALDDRFTSLQARAAELEEQNEQLATALQSAQVENAALKDRIAELEKANGEGKGAETPAPAPKAEGGPKPSGGNAGSGKVAKAG